MLPTLRVLLVEDDEDDYILTADLLGQVKNYTYQLDWVTTYEAALTHLLQNHYQVYLVDYRLGPQTGLELIKIAVAHDVKAPIILLTGLGEYEADQEAMAAGAQDYLVKADLTPQMLERAIRYAIERKQTEAILRNSRNTLRAFLDASTEIMLLVNTDFSVVTLNEAAAKHLTQPLTQIVGQPLNQLMPDSSILFHQLTQLIHTGQPTRFQFQQRHHWFDANLYPLFNHLGQVNQIAIFANDITERKQAEKALQHNEELFRQVITSISDHVYVVRLSSQAEWQSIYHSPGLTNLTGYPLENFASNWLFWHTRVIHPHDQAAAREHVLTLEQGRNSEIEYRIVRANGEMSWVRDSARVETFQEAKTIYGLISDVSERRWADEAIREAYQRLSLYIKHSPMILIEWDTQFRVLHWSQEAQETFGWSAREVVGKAPQEWPFIPSEDLRPFELIIKGLLDGSWSHYVAINSHFTKNGHIIYCEWYIAVLFDENNQMTSILSLILDITERRRAEIALRAERSSLAEKVKYRTKELELANAELKRTARLKDEFLANMSHELRTPLNAILGMAEVLQEQIFGDLNERQLRQVKTIEESGQHLLNLINDILDLSKLEAGMFELHFHPVSLTGVCDISLQFVKQMAHHKQITTHAVYDPQDFTVLADELRLKQILVNLLTNAVKFTPRGGQVGLEYKFDFEQHIINLVIWDTGVGISAENIPHLFQPFVQLDSGLSRSQEGTGLGLYLVYQLVQLHGGGIRLESEIGKGSRFTINLPLKIAHLPNQSTPDLPQPKPIITPVPATILLVEDNKTNLQLMIDYLTPLGYELAIAQSGVEAISKARETFPDLILMDIQMPQMDGFETTRRIRADTYLAPIPIIALTALAMPGDREMCLAAGMNEYLSKPINLHKLTTLIQQFITGKGN